MIRIVWELATTKAGLVLVTIAAGLIFYEGVPIGPLRWIPYVGDALAYMVDGRVDREYARGRNDVEDEARAHAMHLLEKRSRDNEELSDLDLAGLCGELGGRWVPNDGRCD